MISGSVEPLGTSSGAPFIDFSVRREPIALSERIRAKVDTGFNGSLMLPMHWVLNLDLKRDGGTRSTLAEGTIKYLPRYIAYVTLGLTDRKVYVAGGGTIPLVGMELLWGRTLTMDLRDGGKVVIT